jgi:hypothetical protein
MSSPFAFGLNKLARLIAERDAAATENRVPPLNPPWPYEALAFPSQTFGITNYSDAPPNQEV